jgi:hypothetical protein
MGVFLCDTIAWLIVPEQLVCCHIHPLRARHNSIPSLGFPYNFVMTMYGIYFCGSNNVCESGNTCFFFSNLLVAQVNIAVFMGVA